MLTEHETSDVLRGTTLDVYRLMLKARKPVGIREIQRALNLSSPSVAQYHLVKLEQTTLVKRQGGNYVIDKIMLENCIKISHFLIPRYLFYSIFSVMTLLMELTILRAPVIGREYFFYTSATAIFVIIFCYETVKVWLKGSL